VYLTVLTPESNSDRDELRNILDGHGVCDGMAFAKNDVHGTLRIPATSDWLPDGAIELTLSTEYGHNNKVWFWVIEVADSPPRHYVWWNTNHNRDTASPWS
jgi:hypothetical protein